MQSRPDVLDNLRADTSHREALAYLVGDLPGKPLSVATGYVNLGGLHHLADVVGVSRPVRVLLGAMPDPGLGADLPIGRFEHQLAALRGERDFSRFPPSRAADRLAQVQAWLEDGTVEVRRYVSRFLHGKAYLFGTRADPRAALVSSANLTQAGLTSNLELGLVDYNVSPSRAALQWFDGLWELADPFTDDLRDLLFPAVDLVDAETAYLRALLDLYGADLDDGVVPAPARVALADFQRDGYERARRILDDHRGVVYADGVGTGKTEIGLAFLEQYALREGQNALVVCPAQLKDNWRNRIHESRLPGLVLSFNELAADEQLVPDAPNARRHLPVDRDAYRLVVVDEAHALRNEGTTWYRAMQRLLGGERKDAVLLTATPINNGLWDLYNLVMLFARHDRAFAATGIPSARDLFVRAGANERDPENLDPDVLFPLADSVSVRRDRTFIEEHYPGAVFPNGTPVRFPTPVLRTRRYDADSAAPGLFAAVVDRIAGLSMARYRPGAWLVDPDEDAAQAQLGGLIQSALLKRFESSWAACLATVERMLGAHDAFLAAWDGGRGTVPSSRALRDAALSEPGDVGLATWVAEVVGEDPEARPASEFKPDYGDAVAADRRGLEAIRVRLAALSPADDPKLALLRELLEDSGDEKVAVFSTYGETVGYLDEHLPEFVGGRRRIAVVGGQSTPDERTRLISRFCPETVVRPGYVPPDGEVDLLLSTDVLSEGQNLQQAQAVISYDMPWNPQRVVQRNGRVVRLLSPHDEVHLTTMLPAPGELDALLRLEATVRAKIRAAGVYGMDVEVIQGLESELRTYAKRLEAGDETLLAEEDGEEELSGAFLGEELRAFVARALEEGELRRVGALPWGIGAVFRQTATGRSRGPAGVFFAVRTPAMPGAPDGHRYWRYVEAESGQVCRSELLCLRRIHPEGGEPADLDDTVDLEAAWAAASADVLDEHNARADPRRAAEGIGSAQRFALDLLRDPAVILPEGADEAAEALEVERSMSVRRSLNEIRAEVAAGRLSGNDAARRVVDVADNAGLRPVPPEELPSEVTADQLGVVVWMAVLAAA